MADQRSYVPTRPRKLLLRRKEIERLIGKTAERGLTLVPIRIYFTHGLAKMELGMGRGKRQFEKRQATLEREHRRDMDRAIGRRRGRVMRMRLATDADGGAILRLWRGGTSA